MATAAEVVGRFAIVMGVSPHSVDNALRPLRAAGMVPSGGRGGGKAAAHYDARALAHVVLGFAGPLPSDAAEAAAALYLLPWRRSEPAADSPTFGATMFGQALENWIHELATVAPPSPLAERLTQPDWWLSVCLKPCEASVEWQVRGTRHVEHYEPTEPGYQAVLRRTTRIHGLAVVAAGGLFHDTLLAEGRITPCPGPTGPSDSSASSET